MHKEIAKILRCPNCQNKDLIMGNIDSNEIEIKSALIKCPNCQKEFKIENRVTNLLFNLSKTCINEIEATKKEIEIRTDPDKDYLKEKKYEHLIFEDMSLSNYYGIKEFIKGGYGKKALDIGTGGGWLAASLTREGYISAGVDLTDTTFVADFGKEFSLVLSDMTVLPFIESSFDLVTSASAIHHSPNLESSFKEIARILKPEGKVVIINEPVSALFRRRRDYGHEREEGANENCYWVSEYLRASKKAGLKPRLFFPGYIEKKLNQKDLKDLPFGKIASIFSFLFQVKGINQISKAILTYPIYLFFGPQLVMIAEK
jgi:SAM-dependent methyltransferase